VLNIVPDIREATFFAEARDLGALPAEGPPEIAIAGRSNVGKSTLLNRRVAAWRARRRRRGARAGWSCSI
jgi:GTP-binding protein EngB required for normal cell division